MNKIASLLAFCLLPILAHAEWISVGSGSRAEGFIDSASARKSGRFVKVWELDNLFSPMQLAPGKSIRSMKTQVEYDCQNEEMRTLYIVSYSGPMGNGNTVASSAESRNEWRPIVPESVASARYNFLCVSTR